MSDVNTAEATEAAMTAAGIAVTTPVQVSYFGFEETHIVYLPDGVSYIQHKTLNEGARRKYIDSNNRDVRIAKVTGDAIMRMQAGSEKHNLLKSAICGWNLVGASGQPMPFHDSNLQKFLDSTDPKIVDIIEKDVRKKNVWLMADLSVEDIDKQIEELTEMREAKVKEAEGKDS